MTPNGVPPAVTQWAPPPPPPGFVERPRLTESVRQLDHGVALVCAPAGSGKTTLLTSAFAAPGDCDVAWLSLHPALDERTRFRSAVIGSLARACDAATARSLEALWAHGGEQAALPRLVNALSERARPVVLVLDDVHHLRSRRCLGDLGFLIRHAGSALRLLLATRTEPAPALPLHTLRVRSQLTEIRTADLAFTEPEAAALLVAHGLDLPGATVSRLWAKTEGWGAGLRLAALALLGSAEPERLASQFDGSHRLIDEYLRAEALSRHPPARRAFLLRTSIVDAVCGELAEALTDQRAGAETLAALERENGFVLGLDTRREWFRYHALFSEVLRQRAALELREELPGLHARAARWYAAHHMPEPALRHAVQGEQWELATELADEHP